MSKPSAAAPPGGRSSSLLFITFLLQVSTPAPEWTEVELQLKSSVFLLLLKMFSYVDLLTSAHWPRHLVLLPCPRS